MKTTIAALAAALAQRAAAVTLPTLTTIYVETGVRDDGQGINAGIATNFSCSNVSGGSAQIRFLILGHNGEVEVSQAATLAHGATRLASTHAEATFSADIPAQWSNARAPVASAAGFHQNDFNSA